MMTEIYYLSGKISQQRTSYFYFVVISINYFVHKQQFQMTWEKGVCLKLNETMLEYLVQGFNNALTHM